MDAVTKYALSGRPPEQGKNNHHENECRDDYTPARKIRNFDPEISRFVDALVIELERLREINADLRTESHRLKLEMDLG